MEPKDYFPNGAGDALAPLKNNNEWALFSVIGRDGIKKDVYFLTQLEQKTDNWGKKPHLVGEGQWEQKGKYIKGKDAALELFNSLSPENQQRIKDEAYYNKN